MRAHGRRDSTTLTSVPAGSGLANVGAAPELSAERNATPSVNNTAAAASSSASKADAVAAIQTVSANAASGRSERRCGQITSESTPMANAAPPAKCNCAAVSRPRQNSSESNAPIAWCAVQGAAVGEHGPAGVLSA